MVSVSEDTLTSPYAVWHFMHSLCAFAEALE